MKEFIARFVRDEEGQDLIEYALLGAFISLTAVIGADLLGTNLNTWYNTLGTDVGTMQSGLP